MSHIDELAQLAYLAKGAQGVAGNLGLEQETEEQKLARLMAENPELANAIHGMNLRNNPQHVADAYAVNGGHAMPQVEAEQGMGWGTKLAIGGAVVGGATLIGAALYPEKSGELAQGAVDLAGNGIQSLGNYFSDSQVPEIAKLGTTVGHLGEITVAQSEGAGALVQGLGEGTASAAIATKDATIDTAQYAREQLNHGLDGLQNAACEAAGHSDCVDPAIQPEGMTEPQYAPLADAVTPGPGDGPAPASPTGQALNMFNQQVDAAETGLGFGDQMDITSVSPTGQGTFQVNAATGELTPAQIQSLQETLSQEHNLQITPGITDGTTQSFDVTLNNVTPQPAGPAMQTTPAQDMPTMLPETGYVPPSPSLSVGIYDQGVEASHAEPVAPIANTTTINKTTTIEK